MLKQKGISPVIGTVMLVVITLAFGAVVFVWIKSYTSDVGEGKLKDVACRDISFDVGDVCYENLVPEGIKIKFNAVNYLSDSNLSGFLVFLDYPGGVASSLVEKEIESFATEALSTNFTDSITGINKIRFVPRIKKSNNLYACDEKELSRVWSEVNLC